MATEYPYVMTLDKFREFISKLQASGVPGRIDVKYLKSLGYTSSNHRTFPSALNFIGLVDNAGVPTTDRYRALREGDSGKAKIGTYIREAYHELYLLYPDAHRKDVEALRNFFKAQTDLGGVAVAAMAGTFKALCQFASFDGAVSVEEAALEEPAASPPAGGRALRPITINVNIQLSLPPTTDSEVYDKLFSSMAKHIKILEED